MKFDKNEVNKLLAIGVPKKTIAEKLQISRTTLYKYLRDNHFIPADKHDKETISATNKTHDENTSLFDEKDYDNILNGVKK